MALGAEESAESEEDAILANTAPDDDEGDLETALSEARGDEATPQKRGLTPLSKQILLWGAIVAGIYLLFVLGLTLFSNAFASTDAQARQNSAIVTPVACLSYLLPYALPFVAGWRATVREGLGRHGGLAALWSLILYLAVLELVQVGILAFQGKLTGPTGNDLATFAEGFVFQALISFAFGWFGGAYSSWQRRRAERRRAQAAEAATPSA
jgi:hypothetical protein